MWVFRWLSLNATSSVEIVGSGHIVSVLAGKVGSSSGKVLENADAYVSLKMFAIKLGSEIVSPLWISVVILHCTDLRLLMYLYRCFGLVLVAIAILCSCFLLQKVSCVLTALAVVLYFLISSCEGFDRLMLRHWRLLLLINLMRVVEYQGGYLRLELVCLVGMKRFDR